MKKTRIYKQINPATENFRGELFGGQLLSWMDETGGFTAVEYAGTQVTTVAVKEVRFLKRIMGGSILELTAEVVEVGNTSMHVKMEAWVRDGGMGEPYLAADAVFVYVSLGEDGKPQKVRRNI